MSRLTYVVRGLAVAVLVTLAVSGCAGGGARTSSQADEGRSPSTTESARSVTPTQTSTSLSTPSAAGVPTASNWRPPARPPRQPSRAAECDGGPRHARTFWLTPTRGNALEAVSVGLGKDAVVFAHESSPLGLCGFYRYAGWLARTQHVRSVLFDRCTNGQSKCTKIARIDNTTQIASAVTWAREHGAQRVTLVGASLGGPMALNAAGRIGTKADAVVDLSGELSWGTVRSLPGARRIEVPALFAVAHHDRYVSVQEMRRIYNAVPAKTKDLVVLPGSAGHGWGMLSPPDGTGWTRLAHRVADWIHGDYGTSAS